MANTNTNEHPPEHAATPAPIEQAATPTATSGLWPDFYGPKLAELQLESNEITSEVTFAIACDGEITFEDDVDSYDWEDICSRDYKIFRPGAKHSEVHDYLDALGINGDHRGHILEMIFC